MVVQHSLLTAKIPSVSYRLDNGIIPLTCTMPHKWCYQTSNLTEFLYFSPVDVQLSCQQNLHSRLHSMQLLRVCHNTCRTSKFIFISNYQKELKFGHLCYESLNVAAVSGSNCSLWLIYDSRMHSPLISRAVTLFCHISVCQCCQHMNRDSLLVELNIISSSLARSHFEFPMSADVGRCRQCHI